MFARPKRFLGAIVGTLLYWIGWVFAVIVLVQAIILSISTGSPLIPVLLGIVGVMLWLIGIGFRSLLAGRQFRP